MLLEAEPRAGRDRADEHLALRGAGEPDLDLGVGARGVELFVRALRVAAVGDEAGAVVGDEQHRRPNR